MMCTLSTKWLLPSEECLLSDYGKITRQTADYDTYLQVMMMVFSPSQEGLSAMILAWVVTSCGDSWGDSLGWVWIQPRGSISCWRKVSKFKLGQQKAHFKNCNKMLSTNHKHSQTACVSLPWGIHDQAAGWAGGQSGASPTVAPWRCNGSPSPGGCLVDWCHTGSLQSGTAQCSVNIYRRSLFLYFAQMR